MRSSPSSPSTRRTIRLSSLLCAMTAGPVLPPLNAVALRSSRSRPRDFFVPWHSKQLASRMGRMSRAKSTDATGWGDCGGDCAETARPTHIKITLSAARPDRMGFKAILRDYAERDHPQITQITQIIERLMAFRRPSPNDQRHGEAVPARSCEREMRVNGPPLSSPCVTASHAGRVRGRRWSLQSGNLRNLRNLRMKSWGCQRCVTAKGASS